MPIKDIRIIKTEIRNQCKKQRLAMNPQVKGATDAKIAKHLFSLDAYKSTDIVYLFVSKPIEINTAPIIKQVLTHGKRVAVPRCVPNTRFMEFYEYTNEGQLEKGAFGLLEPNPRKAKKITDFSYGVCVVPGLCFDTEGFRLGYGKGYYDRFLSRFAGVKVGICYQNCIKQKLPHGFYDRPVDILLTEQFISFISATNK